MTKYELVDGILLVLGQNSQDRKFLPQQIAWTCDTVIGELLNEWVSQGRSKSDFAVPVLLPVKKDSQLGLRYINLEEEGLGTQSQNGIMSVSKKQDRGNPFVQAKAGDIGIYSALEAGNNSQPTFWIESNLMYFENLAWFIDEVLVVCIPSIKGLSDIQEIPIPKELEGELIRRASQILLGGERVEDKTNDGREG
jgi:hypothetical protein